jgi:hypothetical protein
MLNVRFEKQPVTDFPTLHQMQQVAEFFPLITEIRISGKNVNDQLITNLTQSFPN